MKHNGLNYETEELIAAAQDQTLNIRYYRKHITKQGLTDKCRRRKSYLDVKLYQQKSTLIGTTK